MANNEERREPEDLGQDPYVERMRPDPSQPPEQVRVLEGLMGDSDREGYRRLYFTRELDYYAEFRAEDVVFTEPIPADRPPFLGQEATRVGIRRDATIEYTRSRTPRPVDEFDLDVRLGQFAPRAGLLPAQTWEAECPGGQTGFGITCPWCPQDTWQITICRGRTCPDIDTCLTCETCRTQCGQATCATCQTRCGQPTCTPTCQTCQTQCGQATCQTCPGQATCQTCGTCWTQCNQVTCQDTCRCPTEQRTCFNTRCNTCWGGCEPF